MGLLLRGETPLRGRKPAHAGKTGRLHPQPLCLCLHSSELAPHRPPSSLGQGLSGCPWLQNKLPTHGSCRPRLWNDSVWFCGCRIWAHLSITGWYLAGHELVWRVQEGFVHACSPQRAGPTTAATATQQDRPKGGLRGSGSCWFLTARASLWPCLAKQNVAEVRTEVLPPLRLGRKGLESCHPLSPA